MNSSTNNLSFATPTVLYIIGEGRSGSTLLDMLLGQVDGFESVGELRFVWSRGKRDNQRCGCGEDFNSCHHWNKVVKRFDQLSNDFTHDELAGYAALYYWFPKMFGRHMNETLGKIHFWGTVIPFNFIFIPLFYLGIAGQHRRIYSYEHFMELSSSGFQDLRILATLSLVVMIAFQFVFFYNYISSIFKGKKAEKNPWNANTLEWVAPSPPPHGNFPDGLPTVYRGPYEYSVPGRDSDYWPQNEKE